MRSGSRQESGSELLLGGRTYEVGGSCGYSLPRAEIRLVKTLFKPDKSLATLSS